MANVIQSIKMVANAHLKKHFTLRWLRAYLAYILAHLSHCPSKYTQNMEVNEEVGLV